MLTIHAAIESADPLQVNEIMRSLPDINARQSLDDLSQLLAELLCRYDELNSINEINGCAIMRDIGFVMSSIRKLGVQPEKMNEGLATRMLNLSKITGMVPRDTVYHYSIWNPEGIYQRLFTKFEDEKSLIKSVRYAIVELESALHNLIKATKVGLFAPEFADHGKEAEICLRKSTNALAIAIKQVHPRIFSIELRPYFDPIEINGKSYIASGGGQIPLFLVDKIVWVDKDENESKNSYFNYILESVRYLPRALRSDLSENLNNSSFLALILNAKRDMKFVDAQNTDIVRILVKRLISFREAHARYAAQSFTSENIGKYKTGSAGYEMSFVTHLLNLTQTALSQIEIN